MGKDAGYNPSEPFTSLVGLIVAGV